MAFADYANELVGHLPPLPIFLAERFINRAWADIRRAKPWSFLVAEGFIQIPIALSTGTVTVTQFSTSVVPDATALAAFNLFGANPLISKCQFRRAAGSRIYNIDTWDGTTLTLKEAYQESDAAAGLTYQILRCYVEPPSSDFNRFVSIRDLTTNYYLRTDYMASEINRIDPQRNTSGDPLYVASYTSVSGDATGAPRYELWPHQLAARTYQALYARQGIDFSLPTDSLPTIIPESSLIDRALHYAYQWAEGAKGMNKELMGVDWRYLSAQADTRFREELRRVMILDDEIYLQTIKSPIEGQFMTPIDANYAQGHVTDWQ